MGLKFFLIIISIIILSSCSGKKEEQATIIQEDDIELQMIDAYQKGKKALDEGDSIFAAKMFNEAELLYPQSEWASRSSLMAAYSYYSDSYYPDAIFELERFIKRYPLSKNQDYAYFLLALCYYETIEDEKRDMGPLVKAKNEFSFIVKEYPNSDFSYDAQYKLDLIQDLLSSKEMYLGRHYMKKEK